MTATPALFARRTPQPRIDDAEPLRKLALACLGGAAFEGDITSIGGLSAPDAIFRWPSGAAEGPGAAMAEALSDLAAFPGAECLLEDVLWTATSEKAAEGGAGTYISARATIQGRHDGPGALGAPTGRAVRVRTMAEMWAQDGCIRDAWIVRDTSALLAQTGGREPHTWARDELEACGGALAAPPLGPDTDPEGPYGGRGARTGPAGPLADHLALMMNGEIAEAARGLDPACTLALPGGMDAMGRAAAMGFWAGLRGALPDAAFRIEHAHGMPGGDSMPPRAALRWSLYGRHDGAGRFGPPTGTYLYVLGLTQAEFGPAGIRRLWTLIDDTAIALQLASSRGT